MKKNLKPYIYLPIFVVILAGTCILGVYLGYNYRSEIEKVVSVTNKDPQLETIADFDPFWKAWNILSEKSIYADNITDQDRVWGAISGLTSSLKDPNTVFFPPEESKLFKDEIHGSFEGIGAEIAIKDRVLTVVAPLKNTPAWEAGMKTGDKILKIGEVFTADISIDKAISLMRGPKGTSVKMTILRLGEKETQEIAIERDIIQIPVIETELREDNIFVIKFYSFSENSTDLFKKALLEFINSKSHKLILDMRGNPGGYLGAAVNIGSWFIDEGKVIVSEGLNDNREAKVYRSHGPRIFNNKLSFVVLVDGGSASASEILAGALQQHKVATIIGEKTFGKGTVQELVGLTKDTSLKITVAKWLLPDGKPIPEDGLSPDVEVSLTNKDFEAKRDPQMDKAVEILLLK